MFSGTLKSTFGGVKVGGDGEFICRCGFATREYQVKKDTKNPYYGKQYYACAKYGTDATQCRTWIWFDEKERVNSAIPPEMRSPRTPRKQVDIREYGLYTPPTTLKRKAETQSFDSGVGDLADSTKPGSSTPSRSTKRARSVDAATQTADFPTRPDDRPMPKRRLFDEFIDTSRSSTGVNSDRVAVRAPRPMDSLFGSSIRQRSRDNPRAERGKPISLANSAPSNSKVPMVPKHNVLSRDRRVHFTPPTQANGESENHTAPLSFDSDTESYGWNDELAGDIVDVAKSVDDPRSSPLFV
ncbi:hypothetical protein BJX64DRAFT_225904 [Aspergillus heterothallicus]